MNYLIVLDHLGLGGAQRQAVELAGGLTHRGHRVDVFTYYPQFGFFRPDMERRNIRLHEYSKSRGFALGVVRRLRALRRAGGFDTVISYLNNPNIYTELAGVMAGGAKVIVSERCSHDDDRSRLLAGLRRALHVFSDCVVTNSETHATWLRRKRWLRHKVACIYNGVAVEASPGLRAQPVNGAGLRLLAVGRVCEQKNVTGLIAALDVFHREQGYVPQLSWAGKQESGSEARGYRERVDRMLEQTPAVRRQWRWLGEQADMKRLFREHDVLIHPSWYEGLPNAVCEALAAGMPVLVSNVCDHPRLVADCRRGFIFDPAQPQSIANAIARITALSPTRWRDFCSDAHGYAVANLTVERMVAAYEHLSEDLARQGKWRAT